MRAKEFLSRAYRIDCQITSKFEQLERLKALATSVTTHYGGEQVSRTRSTDTLENNALRIIEAERELKEQIEALVATKKEIRQVIDLVPDSDCRLLLELHYLCRKSYSEIGALMGQSKSYAYRLHPKALAMVEDILRAKEA